MLFGKHINRYYLRHAFAILLGILALIYIIMPFLNYLAIRMSRRAFLTLAISLFTVVMVDELANLTLKNVGAPTAMDFYRSIGMKYQNF